MQAELEALELALTNPARPVMAIVGGAKVSTKLELLGNLVAKVDYLVIGGGMANTFLAAQGKAVGKSLCEHDLAGTAREILEKAKAANCTIVLPVDATVAPEIRGACAVSYRLGRPRRRRRHDPRCRAEVGRPCRVASGQMQDAGLERALRRLRAAALRRGHQRRRPGGGAAHRGGQAALGRGRRRHGGGAQSGPCGDRSSPMSRRPAAPSSNGSKARRCPASRR